MAPSPSKSAAASAPVAIDGAFYGDGCVRMHAPMSPAIHLGADRLLAISPFVSAATLEELRRIWEPGSTVACNKITSWSVPASGGATREEVVAIDTDARTVLGLPPDAGPALDEGPHVEHRRQVEEHHVVARHREVVHHHRSRQVDRHRGDQAPRQIGHVVAHERRERVRRRSSRAAAWRCVPGCPRARR